MFVLQNGKLVSLIQHSKILRQQLSQSQIQRFTSRALSLPFAGQKKLMLLFEEEANVLSQENTHHLLKTLHEYNHEVGKKVQKLTKDVSTQTEKKEKSEERDYLQELLKDIGASSATAKRNSF